MRTIDVRLLVRGDHEPDAALEQLLTGVLRVHAVVELRPDADGVLVATEPVHYHRDVAHYATARIWTGIPLGPDGAGLTVRTRLARVRSLCGEALASTSVDGIDLAREVLAALDEEAE